MAKLKLGILISGRGSNLQALIDACCAADFPAAIVLVISNIPDVYGLTRAQEAGLPTQTIAHKNFKTRETFEQALDEALRNAEVDLVCLAGFMRLLTPWFVTRWQGRMVNIHPSLLPAFPGLHTHKRALEAGVKFTGCTVHYVEAEMDTGPIIVQAAVPVLAEDREEMLAARVLDYEHQAYPLAVKMIARGDVAYEQGRAAWKTPQPSTIRGLLNPCEGKA